MSTSTLYEDSSPRLYPRPIKKMWLYGLCYALFAGPSIFLSGFQPLLLLGPVFFFLFQECFRRGIKDYRLTFVTCIGALNTCSFLFNTNQCVLALNWLVILFCLSFLAIPLCLSKLPLTTVEYIQGLRSLLASWICSLFQLSRWAELFRIRACKPASSIPYFPLAVSGIFLLIFHSLFSLINDQYHRVIAQVFHYLRAVLEYLWDLNLISIFFTATMSSQILDALLCAAPMNTQRNFSNRSLPSKSFRYFLTPICLLFLVFSAFQAEWLTIDPMRLSYVQLSTYVRKGFAELLTVAIIGACLWHYLFLALTEQQRREHSTKLLLLVFSIELTVLTIFSQHKLLIQQLIFGFRDQRVLASCGVALLSLSFFLFTLKTIEKVREEFIFQLQWGSLVALVGFLSLINLEVTMSVLNPIRFQIGDRVIKDYSYLLINSYDNYRQWPDLMREARLSGLPIPKDYYWGGYHSLCHQTSGYQYQINRSLFRDHLKYLDRKYRNLSINLRLTEFAQFNFREYFAFQQITLRKEEVSDFENWLEQRCQMLTPP